VMDQNAVERMHDGPVHVGEAKGAN
jgi:hypothetical protein